MSAPVTLALVFALLTLGTAGASFAQQTPAPRGEIRIVDKNSLNWAWITWQVFEHLVEHDRDGNMVPRLATGWHWLDDRTVEFKLRQGVKFQNGESFDAEIVKLNWEENTRHTQPHIVGNQVNFKAGSKLEILNRETVRFHFPESDGAALLKISLLHMASREFYKKVGWGERHW
jgi:ABC-type transport system substrate-binding protein